MTHFQSLVKAKQMFESSNPSIKDYKIKTIATLKDMSYPTGWHSQRAIFEFTMGKFSKRMKFEIDNLGTSLENWI